MSFPKLEGEPVVGKYYDICPEGALTSNGKQWHGIFKKGKENKTVVYFFGGGVSITEETSKRGKEFYAVDMTAQDFVANGGIGSDADSFGIFGRSSSRFCAIECVIYLTCRPAER